MRLEITTGGQKQAVVLEGRGTVGGGDDDLVRIPGAPPRLVEIWPEGPVWRLKTRVPGKANGAAFPAHIGRVFCAGESIELGGGTLMLVHVAEATPVGTAAVLKDFLAEQAAPAPSLPVFICLTGVDSGRRFSMVAGEAQIGRGEGCAVQIRDGSVSRRHAKVERLGSKFWIEDLDSPNGVFVNNRRISRRAVLADGAIIEVGRTLIRFQAPADSRPSIASGATPKMPAKNDAVERAKQTPAIATAIPELPKVEEPKPKLELVTYESEPEAAEESVIAVNEPEPAPAGLEWKDKLLIAAGIAMMAIGATAALAFS